jgi:hypothetical protein
LSIILFTLLLTMLGRNTGDDTNAAPAGGLSVAGRPLLVGPQAVPMANSISLTSGATIYLYGAVAGGAAPISPFVHGNEITVSDVEGTSTVELAATTHAENSFRTGCAYFDIAGVGISNFSTMRTKFSKLVLPETGGISTGHFKTTVHFNVNAPTLAVAIGMGSSQQAIRFAGPRGLKTDESTNAAEPGDAIGIAHVYLQPGAYRISATTMVQAGGQDTGHMVCLLGVYLFGYGDSAMLPPPLITLGGTASSPPSGNPLMQLMQSFGGQNSGTTTTPPAAGLGAVAGTWEAMMLFMMAFYWLFAFAGLTTVILLCLMFQKCLGSVPKEHRRLEPALAWLMLVPVLGGIWVFVLLFSIAGSYQDYFKQRGRTDIGDCGYGLAKKYLIFAILSVVIPIIGWFILSIVSLVIFIRACMRAWELKRLVEADKNGTAIGDVFPAQPVSMGTAATAVPPTPPPPPPPRNRGDEPPPLPPRAARPAGMPPPPKR